MPSSRSPRGWNSCTPPAAICPTTRGRKKIARATVEILNKAGVDFGILGAEESCCGESIRKTGDEALFKSLARQNIRALVEHGVKKILVSSPHCYHTFTNEYPEFMVHFEVVHISQLIHSLIAEGRLAAEEGIREDGDLPRPLLPRAGTTASTTSRAKR